MSINKLQNDYLSIYTAYEESLWREEMGLGGDSSELYSKLQEFLNDESIFQLIRSKMRACKKNTSEYFVLNDWKNYLEKNRLNDRERACIQSLKTLESKHREHVRKQIRSRGYPPIREISSVISSSVNESERAAAWGQLTEIEEMWMEGAFCEIINRRNYFAELRGYSDFYEYRVQYDEGISKELLFLSLDNFVNNTNRECYKYVRDLAQAHGESVLEGWNYRLVVPDSVSSTLDEYFPAKIALLSWGRTMAALNIKFNGASIKMDLSSREDKSVNGFTSLIRPAISYEGFSPASINLSVAFPKAEGSMRATTELFHEGGHMAHYCNIIEPSVSFSCNVSHILAESQAAFFERFVSSPDWILRHGRALDGKRPGSKEVHEYCNRREVGRLLRIRDMLSVAYLEKAMYELPGEQVKPKKLRALAAEIDKKMTGLYSPTYPLFLVPHLYSVDSSASFHAYPMAEIIADSLWSTVVRNSLGSSGLQVIFDVWKSSGGSCIADLMNSLSKKEHVGHYKRGFVDDFLKSVNWPNDFDIDAEIKVVSGDEWIGTYRQGESFMQFCNKLDFE